MRPKLPGDRQLTTEWFFLQTLDVVFFVWLKQNLGGAQERLGGGVLPAEYLDLQATSIPCLGQPPGTLLAPWKRRMPVPGGSGLAKAEPSHGECLHQFPKVVWNSGFRTAVCVGGQNRESSGGRLRV